VIAIHDVGPFGAEHLGNPVSDALRGARDDGYLTFEAKHVSLPVGRSGRYAHR